jgi:formate dehydrogenase maturation protein FdhE
MSTNDSTIIRDLKAGIIEALRGKVADAIELKKIEMSETIYSEPITEGVDPKLVEKVKKHVTSLEKVSTEMKDKIISSVLKVKDLAKKNLAIEIMTVMDKLGVEVE